MKKFLIILFFVVVAPLAVSADGGAFIWPRPIDVSQTDQNAIIAWNGQEEVLILSTDWKKSVESQQAMLLKVVPLPNEPSDIKEGEVKIFKNLVKILNEKINAWATIMSRGVNDESQKLPEGNGAPGVEVVFQKLIGAHNVTIVKVNREQDFSQWIDNFVVKNNLEKKQISAEFKKGLSNYLKRNIKYFVFDTVNLTDAQNTIKPLIYRFKSNYFYFPMLISGISEISNSRARINLFLIFKDNIRLPQKIWQGRYNYWTRDNGIDINLSNDELKNISENLSYLFDAGVAVRTFQISGKLSEINKDLMLFPQILANNLKIGMRNNDVAILQQLLINEGFWDNEVGATGYFGPITKRAVMLFQNRYAAQILKPLGLTAPTGFFGPYTRKYINENIFIGAK